MSIELLRERTQWGTAWGLVLLFGLALASATAAFPQGSAASNSRWPGAPPSASSGSLQVRAALGLRWSRATSGPVAPALGVAAAGGCWPEGAPGADPPAQVPSAEARNLEAGTTQPWNVTRICRWAEGTAGPVVMGGGYLFAAAGARLRCYDMGSPASPVLLSSLDLPGVPDDMALRGGRLYTVGSGYLAVVDVGDPYDPVLAGSMEIAIGSGWRVAAGTGARVYLGWQYEGLHVIDASDPTQPAETAVLPFSGLADVAGYGLYALVADGSNLRVIDAGDSSAPVQVGNLAVVGLTSSVAVQGSTAYLLVWSPSGDTLDVVDVLDPAAPAMVGQSAVSQAAGTVEASGDLAYLACSDTLQVVDVANPAHPVLRGTMPLGASPVVGLAADGLVAVTGEGAGGFRVIDASQPVAPSTTAVLPSGSDVNGFLVWGYSGLAASLDRGVVSYDLSDLASPVPAGTVRSMAGAYDITLAGAHVVVAAPGKLVLLDLTDPLHPATGGYASLSATCIAGDTTGIVYAASGDSVYALDTSAQGVPVITWTWPDLIQPHVSVSGGYLFISSFSLWNTVIEVFRLTDPAHPAIVAQWPGFQLGSHVAIKGTTAYVASPSGLKVLDIQTITNPILLRAIAGNYKDIALDGDYLYLVGSSGVEMMNIAVPTDPAAIGRFFTGGSGERLAMWGPYPCVADGRGGFSIVRNDLLPPVAAAFSACSASPSPRGVVVRWEVSFSEGLSGFRVERAQSGSRVFAGVSGRLGAGVRSFVDARAPGGEVLRYRVAALADGAEWFSPVVEVYPSEETLGVEAIELDAPSPNPFRETVEFGWTLRRTEKVEAWIVDVRGRRVRSLFPRRVASRGRAALTWDGRDEAGEPVASGVYFFQVRAGGRTWARKVVRVR